MKRKIVIFLAAALITAVASGHAQVTTRLNANTPKEPFMTRMADWFATAGKTQEEKYITLKNRRAARRIKNAKREIARKKRQLGK